MLEEMPPFPERESSLLAKLRKTAPKAAKIHEKALPPVDTVQEAPTTAPVQEPLPVSINEVSYIVLMHAYVFSSIVTCVCIIIQI